MTSSFGERLRTQRESRQVTLDAIADDTKIRVGLLDALEHDDISSWPPGIFRRSYIRDYAVAIGLDPDDTLREFLALYPDPVPAPDALLEATAAAAERQGRRPPTRLQYLIASAIGAVPRAFGAKTRTVPPPTDPVHEILIPPPAPSSDMPLPVGDSLPDPTLPNPPVSDAPLSDVPDVPATDFVGSIDDTGVAPTPGLADDDGEAVAVDDAQLELPCLIDPSVIAVDLDAMARLCTRIGQTGDGADLAPLLAEGCRLLQAIGIIVWPWDAERGELWPSASHGYPPQLLAGLPALPPDAANPIGAAFRSSACQIMAGGRAATAAIVAPLLTARGCAGVLAIECASGLEQAPVLRAMSTILAAQLAPVVEASRARPALA